MIIKLLLPSMCQVLYKFFPIYSFHKPYAIMIIPILQIRKRKKLGDLLEGLQLVSGKAYILHSKDDSDTSSLIPDTMLYVHYCISSSQHPAM